MGSKKEEKKEAIKIIFENLKFPEFVQFEQVFDKRWIKTSSLLKGIAECLALKKERINKELKSLNSLPGKTSEAKKIYKETLNLTKALDKYTEIKRKE